MGVKTVYTTERCYELLQFMRVGQPTLRELMDVLDVNRDGAITWINEVRKVARTRGLRIPRPTYQNGYRYEVTGKFIEQNDPDDSATLSTLVTARDSMTRLETQLADFFAVRARLDGRTVIGKAADRCRAQLKAARYSLEDVEAVVAGISGSDVKERQFEPEWEVAE